MKFPSTVWRDDCSHSALSRAQFKAAAELMKPCQPATCSGTPYPWYYISRGLCDDCRLCAREALPSAVDVQEHAVASRSAIEAVVAKLKPAEREIVKRLKQGQTQRQVARALQVDPGNVSRRVSSIAEEFAVAGVPVPPWLHRVRNARATSEPESRVEPITP